jgi:hypothetical protein
MDYVSMDYAQYHFQEHEEILRLNGEHLSANILADLPVLLHHQHPESFRIPVYGLVKGCVQIARILPVPDPSARSNSHARGSVAVFLLDLKQEVFKL